MFSPLQFLFFMVRGTVLKKVNANSFTWIDVFFVSNLEGKGEKR